MGSRKFTFDWLPEGWKTESRVRSSGKRDRYYIDPLSGYAFRSMNEVFRYLNTGRVGRRTFKAKDKDLMKQKSRDHPLFSTAETGKLRSHENSKGQKLVPESQNSESDAEVPPMQIVDLQTLATLMPCERKEGSSGFLFPLVGKLVIDLCIEKRVDITDSTSQCKEQKNIIERMDDLPLITSKQVAGDEVELPQILKAWNEVPQATATSTSTGAHEDMHVDDCKNVLTSEDCGRLKTGNDDDKQEDLDSLTWSNDLIQEEYSGQVFDEVLPEEEGDKPGVNEYKAHEHQEIDLNASFRGLWDDPCIEFAIKTLTGELPISKDEIVTKDPEPLVEFHDAGGPFSCQESPKGEECADPCYESSVKTSTGNETTVNNEQAGNVVLQQKCSSKAGALSWPTFADYKVNNFSWTNISYRHSDIAKVHVQQKL